MEGGPSRPLGPAAPAALWVCSGLLHKGRSLSGASGQGSGSSSGRGLPRSFLLWSLHWHLKGPGSFRRVRGRALPRLTPHAGPPGVVNAPPPPQRKHRCPLFPGSWRRVQGQGWGLGGGTCQGEAHPPGPPTALIQGLSTAIPWVRWTRLEGDVLTLTSWAEVAAEAV